MSAFLTPDGEPFFCGTYFPPSRAAGWRRFRQVLESLARRLADQARRDRRASARAGGRAAAAPADATEGRSTRTPVTGACRAARGDFDPVDAGFGAAPKFPPSMVLDFLLRHHRRTGSDGCAAMVAATCERMARGGMYDQLAGGFARYCVDGQWVVPHFEKMLYDNALLLDVYTHWWTVGGDPLARRVAEETADFLLARAAHRRRRVRLRARRRHRRRGGQVLRLDAGSSWPRRWARTTPVGQRPAATSPAGTFEHGSSVLQLRQDPDDPERWQRIRRRLLAPASDRTHPGRDDKVVAAWNGLAITALAAPASCSTSPSTSRPRSSAARLVRDVHLDDARPAPPHLARRRASARPHGVLEDYAAYAQGCLHAVGCHRQHRVVRDGASAAGPDARAVRRRWLLLRHGGRRRGAGLASAGPDRQRQPVRRRAWPPRPSPAGQPDRISPATRRRRAGAAASATIADRAPRFAGRALAVAETVAAGPLEIAIVGRVPGAAPDRADRGALGYGDRCTARPVSPYR